MANEHTLVYELERPIPFTVANATGIEKGALLKMTDPMTAIIVSAANNAVAGVAAEEKIASDGVTKLAVYRGGIFKATASGAITVGDALVSDVSVNYLKTAPVYTTISGANIVGIALETAANSETFLYQLKPMTVRYA